jgi:hypothetical protein
VTFTNFQTTPQCSPSRAAFFTGRYPLRTGVTSAILDEDLPAAHVSPFEITTPRLLSTAGYNLDKRADLNDLRGIAQYWGLPSVFDFNKDGVTNSQDMPEVLNNCAAIS